MKNSGSVDGSVDTGTGARGVRDAVEVWTVERLVALVPGSTRRWWLDSRIPVLKRCGALIKAGRTWLGRRSEIEAALMTPVHV